MNILKRMYGIGIILTILLLLQSSKPYSDTLDNLGFEKVLFIKHPAYFSSHFYTFFVDGMDEGGRRSCFHKDNGIYYIDLKSRVETQVILASDKRLPGDKGIFGRFDLSYDATRIVFDYRATVETGFRIYEIDVNGENLRQLTFDLPWEKDVIEKYGKFRDESRTYNKHIDDMHPCYSPDGRIIFTSTRVMFETFCNSSGALSTANIHRLDPSFDTPSELEASIEQISINGVSEFAPSVLNDGRIIFTRWEYLDKSSVSIKTLWSIYPDGSKGEEVYGLNHNIPSTFYKARAVPGNNHYVFCDGVPHFPQGGVGTVLRIDTRKDIRTKEPMELFTPVFMDHYEAGWTYKKGNRWASAEEGVGCRLYDDPYPLNEHQVLVACKINELDPWDHPNAYGIYLLDEAGNHEEILHPENTSCWVPYPLKPRPLPPIISEVVDPDLKNQKKALVILTDVNRGLTGVPRGSVKYIRVNEQIPRPWGSNTQLWDYEYSATSPQGDAHMWIRLQRGVVEVEEDGSAQFYVPADRSLFFEVLDSNYMAIQRERTWVNFRPGETRSCIGCHERSGESPGQNHVPLALTLAPQELGPQPGEERGFRLIHYESDVQPIWDKHCISCHGSEKAAGNLNLTNQPRHILNASYLNLKRRKPKNGKFCIGDYVREDDPDPYNDGQYREPYSFGAHTSWLIDMLKEGHQGVELSKEEMIRISTWMDNNIQYYGHYYGGRLEGEDHYRVVLSPEEALSPTAPWDPDER